MELKTLKDLRTQMPKNEHSEELDYFVSCKILKQEAIKWIKVFDLKIEWANENLKDSSSCAAKVAKLSPKPERELTNKEQNIFRNIYEQSFRIGFIRFFNIPEEELK